MKGVDQELKLFLFSNNIFYQRYIISIQRRIICTNWQLSPRSQYFDMRINSQYKL